MVKIWVMLRQVLMLVFAGGFFGGCVGPSKSPEDRFLSRGHYVLRKKDAGGLEGPYRMKKILASNKILIEFEGQVVEVIIRGCRLTGNEKLDSDARVGMESLSSDGAYVRTDCKQVIDKTHWKAVVYRTANKVGTVDENLKVHSTVLTYAMPQLLNLAYGYALLDMSDTDYPLYEVFRAAEQVARENRNGYWATHSD